MKARYPLVAVVLGLTLVVDLAPATAQAPMTWAVHVSLAPTWFDPAEHTGSTTAISSPLTT